MILRNLIVFIISMIPLCSIGRSYVFDTTMINDGESNVDFSLFNDGLQLPGKYFVSVYVNGNMVDKRYIAFKLSETEKTIALKPCLLSEDLKNYGFNLKKIPKKTVSSDGCFDFELIPQADVVFNFNQQRLSIIVPSKLLLPKNKDYVSEDLWDEGVPALLMNYQVDAQKTRNKTTGKVVDYSFMRLQPGVNVGAWRLRSTVNWQRNQGWQRSLLYAERGLRSIKSRIVLGEIDSSGFLFDNTPITGGKIASDESMLAYEQWSYTPVVRGIARTQARVEVKQNGYIIANNIVPPGPFELNDIPSGGGYGNLDVTVYENDGSQQKFVVPYYTPAIAVRQGYLGYNIVSGKYRPSNNHIKKSNINSFEIKYGLPWDLTLYTGGQFSDNYHAEGIGIGAMMGRYGAVSSDFIFSNSKSNDKNIRNGNRLRINYSNAWSSASVNAVSEFMTKGYRSITEDLDTYRKNNLPNEIKSNGMLTNKNTLNVGVRLKNAGHLNFSGVYQRDNYNRENISYGVSYSNTFWKGLSFNLGWLKNEYSDNSYGMRSEDRVSLWLNIPLSQSSTSSSYASLQSTYSASDGSDYEAGLHGRLLNNQFWWDFRERYYSGKQINQNSVSVSSGYRGAYGEVWGGYNRNPTIRQLSGRVNGKVILTKEGVVAGQNYGDTVALIKAPGASGLSVGYLPGVKTDFRGYAIAGSMRPYRKNTIDINPAGLSEKVSLIQTSSTVVPTKGAVVFAPFQTLQGERVLLTLIKKDKKPVPFGSVVTIGERKDNAAIVGDNGEVYLTGVSLKSTLNARWGKSPNQTCLATIDLSKKNNSAGLHYVTAHCI
ncbi:UNVERIFIED_ORG: outer membrane usher protein [Citrobacter freundii]